MGSQVPCVGCAHCGNHTHPDYSRARYNGSASSTAVSHTGTYHVGYAEGSSGLRAFSGTTSSVLGNDITEKHDENDVGAGVGEGHVIVDPHAHVP